MPDHRKKKGSKAQKQSEAETHPKAQKQCDNQLQHNAQTTLNAAAWDFGQLDSARVNEPQPTLVSEPQHPACPQKEGNKTKDMNGSFGQLLSTPIVQSVSQPNGTTQFSPTEEVKARLSEQSNSKHEDENVSESEFEFGEGLDDDPVIQSSPTPIYQRATASPWHFTSAAAGPSNRSSQTTFRTPNTGVGLDRESISASTNRQTCQAPGGTTNTHRWPPSSQSEGNQVSSGSGRGGSYRHPSAPGCPHFPDKHDKTMVFACHAPCNHGNHSRPVHNSAIVWAATQHMLNTETRRCTQFQWRIVLEQNNMGYMIGDRGQIAFTAPSTQECRTGGQRQVQNFRTNDRGLGSRVHYIEARDNVVVCGCQTPYSHANAKAVGLAIERVALRIMRQTGQETCSKDELFDYSL